MVVLELMECPDQWGLRDHQEEMGDMECLAYPAQTELMVLMDLDMAMF
jgi:hypothetical protein